MMLAGRRERGYTCCHLFDPWPLQGDTTEALICLANNPFLLAYGTYAQDGDTVSPGGTLLFCETTMERTSEALSCERSGEDCRVMP